MLNVQNRTLFHGDNLYFLREINSESIDLIATDPPFCKQADMVGADGKSYQDRWTWTPEIEAWWEELLSHPHGKGAYEVIDAARVVAGNDISAFLAFMGVRLFEMKRILKPTGSIYVHMDSTAGAWTKAMMDAVFGRKNFRNEIIWWYKGTGRPRNQFPRKHDTVLFYSFDAATFNPVEIPAAKKSGWTGKDTKLCDAVWEINTVYQSSERASATGYPSQKPEALYERIIEASSNEGDVVLDPFMGSGTTLVAAAKLGRQFIGMDLGVDAINDTTVRLSDLGISVGYNSVPPRRTDKGDYAINPVDPAYKRPPEEWEKLTTTEIKETLLLAVQVPGKDLYICAGCGRAVEQQMMDRDHITPLSDYGENNIRNSCLLCHYCNILKQNKDTISGLRRQLKKMAKYGQPGGMVDEATAKKAFNATKTKAEWKIIQLGG